MRGVPVPLASVRRMYAELNICFWWNRTRSDNWEMDQTTGYCSLLPHIRPKIHICISFLELNRCIILMETTATTKVCRLDYFHDPGDRRLMQPAEPARQADLQLLHPSTEVTKSRLLANCALPREATSATGAVAGTRLPHFAWRGA